MVHILVSSGACFTARPKDHLHGRKMAQPSLKQQNHSPNPSHPAVWEHEAKSFVTVRFWYARVQYMSEWLSKMTNGLM